MWILRSMHERISFNVYRHVENILDVLSRYGVPATFFITGEMAEKHPRVPQRIRRHGHEIASHGYSHKDLTKTSFAEAEKEISESIAVLSKYQEICGFRAPFLMRNQVTYLACEKLGLSYDSSEHGLTKYCPKGSKVVILPVISPLDTQGLDLMRLKSQDLAMTWLSKLGNSHGATVGLHVWRMGRRKYIRVLLEPLLKSDLVFVEARELLNKDGVALTFNVEYANLGDLSPASVWRPKSFRLKPKETLEARNFPT